jgi:hypothetical protein
MQKITTIAELKSTIHGLENKQAYERDVLKEQLLYTYENLRPINILKNTFKEVYSAPDTKTNMVNTAVGIATGFIAKKVFLGKTQNPFKKLLGFIVEIAIANKVAKNMKRIESIQDN